MIVYNHNPEGSVPIVIITKWHADPLGGPAVRETTIMLNPGDGIDLDVLNLKERNPKEKICQICLLTLEETHDCRGYSFGLKRK